MFNGNVNDRGEDIESTQWECFPVHETRTDGPGLEPGPAVCCPVAGLKEASSLSNRHLAILGKVMLRMCGRGLEHGLIDVCVLKKTDATRVLGELGVCDLAWVACA